MIERGMMSGFLRAMFAQWRWLVVNGIKLAGGDQVAGAVSTTGEGEFIVTRRWAILAIYLDAIPALRIPENQLNKLAWDHTTASFRSIRR